MGRKPQGRKLLPVGRTDMLTAEAQARVQAYAVASRLIPSGSRTAHNVQVLAEFIMGS